MQIRRRWRPGVAGIIAALAVLAVPAALQAQTPSTVELVNNATYGDILVDGDGLTLYIFTPDEPGVSNCNGGCAVAWPPLTVADGETPTAGAGVTGALTLITRDDGSQQVALDGAALYYYRDDNVAGDTNGQAVNDVWWVIDGAGTVNQTAPPPPTIQLGGNEALGEFIVAGANGWTLYIFTPDAPGVSNCNGGCAAAWPPLTVADGEMPTAGAGIDGEVSLITRDDGSQQVALDGAALYFYRDDGAPGDSNGQDVNDVWFVIDATGAIVETPGGVPETAGPPPVAAPAGTAGLTGTDSASTLLITLLTLATAGLVLGGRRVVRNR